MSWTAEQQRAMAARIGQWHAMPHAPVACPACGKAGLQIIDRSARPHAEWYALACHACGLDETLHIALGATVQRLD